MFRRKYEALLLLLTYYQIYIYLMVNILIIPTYILVNNLKITKTFVNILFKSCDTRSMVLFIKWRRTLRGLYNTIITNNTVPFKNIVSTNSSDSVSLFPSNYRWMYPRTYHSHIFYTILSSYKNYNWYLRYQLISLSIDLYIILLWKKDELR